MFNQDVIKELQKTNNLLEHLTKRITNGNSGLNDKLNDIRDEISELLQVHQAEEEPAPFQKHAPRPNWGTLSRSDCIDPQRDVGVAIAIPTRIWSSARLVWNTIHLLGYICPSSNSPGFPGRDVDVIVISRKGSAQRYGGMKNFAKDHPHYYRMSLV